MRRQHCTKFFSYISVTAFYIILGHVTSQAMIAQPIIRSLHLFPIFSVIPFSHETVTSCTNTPPSPLPTFFSSYFLSFLICTPEGFVCLLTSWSKASAGLRLAPIIRAWQGAAVSTCQPNKHPLWHPPGCVLRGVSQPPSSGPLISWMPHNAYTSTRLLCSGQAAIVLPMQSHTYDTHTPRGFPFSLRKGWQEEKEN